MKTTDKKLGLISALGAGAGLMYIFDPLIGRRRRAFVRDKVVRLGHKTADAIDASMRDLKTACLDRWPPREDSFSQRTWMITYWRTGCVQNSDF